MKVGWVKEEKNDAVLAGSSGGELEFQVYSSEEQSELRVQDLKLTVDS